MVCGRNVYALLSVGVLLLLASGCAVMETENRRVLNSLDQLVQFESTSAKVAAAPVFVPIGVAAGLTDMVIVHPAVSIPEAGEDTWEVLWKNPQGSEFRQMMLFLPKVVASPILFVTDWVARCFISFQAF